MSKYIKLEDAISKIVNTPTRVITDDLTALADRQHEIIDMLADLPTIEVSEDCISRADLLKTIDDNVSQQYTDTYETYGLDLWGLFVRIVKNAPSVVPKAPSEDNKAYTYCSRCGMRVVVDAPKKG